MSTSAPLFLIDFCEASNTFTTSKPNSAFAKGSFEFMIQSIKCMYLSRIAYVLRVSCTSSAGGSLCTEI